MRILQVIYSLSSGGAERFTVDLANKLAEYGHDVAICVVRDLSILDNRFYLPELSPSVQVIDLKIKPGFSFAYWTHLDRAIRSFRPDIVHGHLAGIANYLLGIRWLHPRIRFVNTIHNDARAQSLSKIDGFLRSLAYRSGYLHAVTISASTTRSFIDYYGFQPSAEIYNGRSTLAPSDSFDATRDEIQALKPSPSSLVFLHAGRFARQKNQGLLVRSFQRLVAEGEDVLLLMLGAGFDTDEGRKFQEAAGTRVHFLGARPNIGDFFHAADAFCLSSLHEGLPITILEALCCGCPAISTPVGGVVDVVEESVTGFLSEDLSEESYLRAMRRYLAQRKSLDKSLLMQRFEERYSLEKCARAYQALYRADRSAHQA